MFHFLLIGWPALAGAAECASHSPVWPPPQAAARPLENGPTKYVDGVHGNDAGSGLRDKPRRTIAAAVTRVAARPHRGLGFGRFEWQQMQIITKAGADLYPGNYSTPREP